jgi:hypothetical protein
MQTFAIGLTNAASAVLYFQTATGYTNAQQSLTDMNNYLTQWISDFSGDMQAMWVRGYERWQFVWGGYWSNFALSIILIAIFAILICVLQNFCLNN